MKKEKSRLIRIIIDTLRQEELLTHISPKVDEKALELKRKDLEKLTYEQLLETERICKNSKKYFYEVALKREKERQIYIDKIIEISRLEDLNDQIYSSEEVYEKFRNILDEYSFEKVKSLLEVYRRRKTQLYDQVMNCQNIESKLIR